MKNDNALVIPAFSRRARSAAAKLSLACALGLGAGVSLQTAHATLFMEEGFDYNTGTLAGKGPWTNSSSVITVGSGSLTYSGLADVSPGANRASVTTAATANFTARPIGTPITSGSVYCSFLLNYTTTGGNYYFAGLLPSIAPNGSAADPCDLIFNAVTSGYQLGIRGLGKSMVLAPTVLGYNTVNLAVLKYDFSTGLASLFLNPTPGGTEPTANATSLGTSIVASLSTFYLREGGNSTQAPYSVDSIRVASTWSEVVPAAVPEPGTGAFLVVGFGAMLVLRRRAR